MHFPISPAVGRSRVSASAILLAKGEKPRVWEGHQPRAIGLLFKITNYSKSDSYRRIWFVWSFLFSRLGPTRNRLTDLLVSFYPTGPNFLPVEDPKSLQVLEFSARDTRIGLGEPGVRLGGPREVWG